MDFKKILISSHKVSYKITMSLVHYYLLHYLLANGKDMQRMINTHIEASKIGRQIAEQVMDSQKQGGESSSDSSPNPDPESSLPLPTADVSYC